MPTLKFDIDRDTLERLQDLAHRERRYVPQQAEVLLMQVLGLWSPHSAAEIIAPDRPLGLGERDAAAHDR